MNTNKIAYVIVSTFEDCEMFLIRHSNVSNEPEYWTSDVDQAHTFNHVEDAEEIVRSLRRRMITTLSTRVITN